MLMLEFVLGGFVSGLPGTLWRCGIISCSCNREFLEVINNDNQKKRSPRRRKVRPYSPDRVTRERYLPHRVTTVIQARTLDHCGHEPSTLPLSHLISQIMTNKGMAFLCWRSRANDPATGSRKYYQRN